MTATGVTRSAPVAAERRIVVPAMGSQAELVVVDLPPREAEALLRGAAALLAELERQWTRFHSDSELQRLNHANGRFVAVSEHTLTLLESMVLAHTATGGAFDPSMLAAQLRLGDPARSPEGEPTRLSPVATLHGRPAGIVIDRAAGAARLPAGTMLDAGGIGKGLAADIVSEWLVHRGAAGALVSVGGDLRVRGRGSGADEAWCVGVGDVQHIHLDVTSLVLSAGGVATSSASVRRWTDAAGIERHHLLDPRTAAPTRVGGDIPVQVTVVAGSAMWAEALTKVVMIDGIAAGLDVLQQRGIGARAVAAGGEVVHNRCWDDFQVVDGAVVDEGTAGCIHS
jgi:thiamine biosynthesis lipoprotein